MVQVATPLGGQRASEAIAALLQAVLAVARLIGPAQLRAYAGLPQRAVIESSSSFAVSLTTLRTVFWDSNGRSSHLTPTWCCSTP